MQYDVKAFDVENPEVPIDFVAGAAFYRALLESAGAQFNRQLGWQNRIAYWNLDLSGDEATWGKYWTKRPGGKPPALANGETRYLKLFNLAAEQSLAYFYQFFDTEDPDRLPVYEEGNERQELFQNLVRFTIADYWAAMENDENVKIRGKSAGVGNRQLSSRLPVVLRLGKDPAFYPVAQDQTDFFVDMDYPQYYFVQEGGTWKRFQLSNQELETTEVVYWLADGEVKTGLLTVPRRRAARSGGGGGAMRADAVDEVEYRWSGNRAYGTALGLDLAYYLQPGQTAGAGFYNVTPRISGTNRLQAPIQYYKKFKPRLAQRDKKNSPFHPIPPVVHYYQNPAALKESAYYYSTDFFKLRQIGQQHAFGNGWTGLRLLHNNSRGRDDASSVMGKALASYDSFLASYQAWRQGADHTTPEPAAAVSANDFTDFVLSAAELQHVQENWEALKRKIYADHGIQVTNSRYPDWNRRRTEQEWCHLYGHGDGGAERWGNFVAGSKHCNTTQLAIETGQRKGKFAELSVKVSAYLFEHFLFKKAGTVKLREVLDYLAHQFGDTIDHEAASREFRQKLELGNINSNLDATALGRVLIDKAAKSRLTTLTAHQRIKTLEQFCISLPLAKLIHYKIYYHDRNIFDYFFDAQSESFDYHEFKILQNLVVRAIAIARSEEEDKDALSGYLEEMVGKLQTQVNQGRLAVQDYNRLLADPSESFGIPLDWIDGDAMRIDFEAEEVDSSEDEAEDEEVRERRNRRSGVRATTGVKRRQARSLSAAKATAKAKQRRLETEAERQRVDYDFHPMALPDHE
jgi:hypothetical protein